LEEAIMNNPETLFTVALASRIPLGALALILAGLILAPTGVLMRGVPTAPARNLEFAAGANSTGWRFGMAMAGLSLALFILGTSALYAHLSQTQEEGLAFAGLIVTVGFLALMLPVPGFAAYVVPAVGRMVAQGQAEVVEVMNQTFKEPFLAIPFLSGILWNVGSVLLGIAILRSGTLPSWTGLLYIAYGVLGIPAFLDVKALQIVAPLVGGAAQVAVGLSLWQLFQ
jgi:hypothetical protein